MSLEPKMIKAAKTQFLKVCLLTKPLKYSPILKPIKTKINATNDCIAIANVNTPAKYNPSPRGIPPTMKRKPVALIKSSLA